MRHHKGLKFLQVLVLFGLLLNYFLGLGYSGSLVGFNHDLFNRNQLRFEVDLLVVDLILVVATLGGLCLACLGLLGRLGNLWSLGWLGRLRIGGFSRYFSSLWLASALWGNSLLGNRYNLGFFSCGGFCL